MVYENFILQLVFALYFDFGISMVEMKIKIQNYFKSLLSNKHKNMAVEKNLKVMINFYKKHCLPVVTQNKNNLLKQVVPITYTLKKSFLQLLYF